MMEKKIMKIKQKLKLLAGFFLFNRQAGHTTAAIEGLKTVDKGILLASNLISSRMLKQRVKGTGIAVRTLGDDLREISPDAVILLDNDTVRVICLEAVAEIERLEKQNKMFKEKLEIKGAHAVQWDGGSDPEKALSATEGVLENALDALIEVGNGTTDELLHATADDLFTVRDVLLPIIKSAVNRKKGKKNESQ